MAKHLTDAIVKRLPLPAKANQITYDDAVAGFGVRVTAGGSRSFILNYRTKAGRERRITIGSHPDWRTTAARDEARRLKQIIDRGGDPLADIEDDRGAPTVANLADRFEREHLPRKRSGTAADYRLIVSKHIRPHFGLHTKVADVSLDDIEKLHRKITARGHLHRANRTVAVLSKMFSLAIRWRMRPDNPCKGVERNQETKRRRYLSADELSRLLAALGQIEDKQAANVIRLLLLSGARRGEALAMRWVDLDLTAGKWTKPAATTKQKLDHEVPLSAAALKLLAEIRRRTNSDAVFPGTDKDRLRRAWIAVCKAAKISNLRVHDLRHSFASQLASGGANLPLIGALLGHSNPTTTHRYAHLFDDPLRAAVDRVGATIAAAERPKVRP